MIVAGVVAFIFDFFFLALGSMVLTLLWAWFIVPIFGMTELNVVQAAGIIIVARFLTSTARELDKDEDFYDMLYQSAVRRTAFISSMLLFGYITSRFM